MKASQNSLLILNANVVKWLLHDEPMKLEAEQQFLRGHIS